MTASLTNQWAASRASCPRGNFAPHHSISGRIFEFQQHSFSNFFETPCTYKSLIGKHTKFYLYTIRLINFYPVHPFCPLMQPPSPAIPSSEAFNAQVPLLIHWTHVQNLQIETLLQMCAVKERSKWNVQFFEKSLKRYVPHVCQLPMSSNRSRSGSKKAMSCMGQS